MADQGEVGEVKSEGGEDVSKVPAADTSTDTSTAADKTNPVALALLATFELERDGKKKVDNEILTAGVDQFIKAYNQDPQNPRPIILDAAAAGSSTGADADADPAANADASGSGGEVNDEDLGADANTVADANTAADESGGADAAAASASGENTASASASGENAASASASGGTADESGSGGAAADKGGRRRSRRKGVKKGSRKSKKGARKSKKGGRSRKIGTKRRHRRRRSHRQQEN